MGAAKILIVEDDVDFKEIIESEFRKKGYEVSAQQNGFNAAECIRTEIFDAIIADIRVPGVDGLQLAAVARSSKCNRDVPIHVVSGSIDKVAAAKAKSLAVTTMSVKPVDPSELIKKVEESLANKNAVASYDARVIKCFVAAVREVLGFYFGEAPEVGKPFVKKGKQTKGYATGLIGFSGSGIMGSVSITSDKALMSSLAEKVFMAQDVQLDDEMLGDLAGEMANQIVGKVKINFANIGLKINIGLPEVVTGEGHTVYHKASNPVLCVPVKYKGNDCIVEVCMTDNAEEQIDEDNKPEEEVKNVVLWD